MQLTFRRHRLAYLCVNVALFAIDALLGGAWWFHFIAFIWGLALMIHFMVVKSLNVDDAWVEDRVIKLRISSYDLGHIIQISDNYNKDNEEDPRDDDGAVAPR
ncbi:MAG: 2TM domain-containing protein [Alphaproteobacteria bacterium]|nr:2TM domain-containing protein [Alphaproteobacteria bacterium]